MRGRVAFLAAVAVVVLCAATPAFASDANVSVGSPPDMTPQNHQNEPAVAVDANHPSFAVSGWNDFVDWAPCPQADATQFGTCADPADDGVGLSAVAFTFDRGHTWVQPTYTGWTAADCPPTSTCAAHEGPIHTLPWYYENRMVSSGDPAVAVGPIPSNGHFAWANGSRVYYANLTGAWPSGFAFPNPEFHGYLAVGVSRLDNPTPASVLNKASWKPPVISTQHAGQTAFEDKEQIWADNASSSPFFGRVYVCNAEFRSNGRHAALGGNAPAPLTVSVSRDGGDTWTAKSVTSAATNGKGPNLWGLSGCTLRTDSHGVVYLFSEMFENPTATNEIVDVWADNDGNINANTAQMSWSLDGGSTWAAPLTASLAGDRPLYAAPAISPTGDRMYVVYEADTAPWRGADMTSPRPYHGVFLTAPVAGGGAPGSWSIVYDGSTDTAAGHNDLRATYPGHDIYQERVGDYVYAAATATYGLSVWTDAQRATVCTPVQSYRAASLAAGERALPAPWPLADCPATFGNTDTWSATTG
ncbi:MAG: exo-alpha-sialidase [Acidobacteria bacterium]|nr:exo-alpha-sialidase [Acidobacteriota bacterium]